MTRTEADQIAVLLNERNRLVHAFVVYSRAETTAVQGRACIVQCTIRHGNSDSEKFFRRQGFTNVGASYYERTGNDVGIWQKVLQAPHDEASAQSAG
jgi:hypothetical protein